jgi:hypothetical protein
MFILNNTNGKIKGVKFGINNIMTMFLTDGDSVDISLKDNTLEDFILKIKDIDESISEDFLKRLYGFKKEE